MGSSKRKRRRDSDLGGATAESAELKTVYVDTSLDTHLVVLVHSSDTASDLKKKVAMEHKHCFPEIGRIHVHTAKIKCKMNYYYLADAIPVWSAFHGVKTKWFLSADVSNIPITNSSTDKDDDGRGLIFDANMKETLPLALPGSAAEENVASEMIVEPKVIKPVEKTTDSPKSIYSEEHYVGIKSPVKKKRKVGHKKEKGHNSNLEGVDVVICADGNYGKPNAPNLDIEGRLVSDKTSLPSMTGKSNLVSILDSRNVNSSATREEDNRIQSMVHSGLGEDVGDLGVVSVLVPGSSARNMDVESGDGDVSTAGSMRKKKKVRKTAAKFQDTADTEKPDNIVTGSSFQKKIPSLDNSSSERSQTLNNNVGNEMPQLGQNATSMTPMKTPKKKISSAKSGAILHNNMGKDRPMLGQNATILPLMKTPKKKISLAKSGAIFEDDSGESSGDENGTMHLDVGTLSPSDSSSTSGDSAGESGFSQNSVNDGCNDSKEISSSKFDLSAREDLTMDVILRSSKRFKKAKQLASQNETEPIEYLPASQPLL